MSSTRELLIDEQRGPGDIAVISLRNGRLNTLTRPLRTDLLEALDRAEADTHVRAVILRGAAGVFSAGAELTEFDSGHGLAEPSLHDTILTFLDNMTKPVIALLEGLALGGGLELALGCHYRVSTPGALIGLPEVTFGFLPGAGGTQRLPRAIGLERGLSFILTAKRVPAHEIGLGALIARFVHDDPLDEAVAFAAEVADRRPIPRLRDVDLYDDAAESLLTLAARTHRNAPARASAIAAVQDGLRDVERGFATEQRLFRELAGTTEASARRHLFLAERSAKHRPAGDIRSISRVGVVGGGTMGRGIALAHALAGFDTHLIETDSERVRAAHAAIEADAARRLRAASPTELAETLARISYGTDLTELHDADLVVEAVPEIITLKLDVFGRLDEAVGAHTILATNTSSLNVDRIAGATRRPSTVVGMHFFSPAHIMRLVEVVRGAETTDAVLATVMAHAERLGKIPVVSGVGPGFIGNRILEASSREVGLLLLEGATPAQIDAALERWGMRMGPLRVLDLVGNDVPMHTRQEMGVAELPHWRPSAELVAAGRLGVKSGNGWYRYADGIHEPDTEVDAMIRRVAQDLEVPQHPITDQEIVERVILAMVNEGAAVLEEGISARAGDIDVVFTNGYGYPKDRGGPMHTADTMGLHNVIRIMRRFAARPGGEYWTPRPLLFECAQRDQPLSTWGEVR